MSLKVTWFGHAALGLEVGYFQVLVDPFFTGSPVSNVNIDTIPADFILVTHGHGDHVGDTVAIARRTGATVIAVYEIANWLAGRGVQTHAQHLGGGYRHPFGYLKLTMALHGSSLPDGSYGGNPAGFLLTTEEGKKVYIAGDTGLFGDMRLIGEEGIDLAVLPIGDNFTMGPEDALRAVRLIQPRHVLPIHYGTWDVIEQNARAWVERVERDCDTKAHLLKPGESLTL